MYAKSESKSEYRSLVKQEVRKERFQRRLAAEEGGLQRKVAAQLQLAHARARAHRIGKSCVLASSSCCTMSWQCHDCAVLINLT